MAQRYEARQRADGRWDIVVVGAERRKRYAIVAAGFPAKDVVELCAEAFPGTDLTAFHARPRYFIRFTRKTSYDPSKGGRHDWRAYRETSAWPILFETARDAERFSQRCLTFKNLEGKWSASIESVRRTR